MHGGEKEDRGLNWFNVLLAAASAAPNPPSMKCSRGRSFTTYRFCAKRDRIDDTAGLKAGTNHW
jgi:hypothetical protein